MERSQIMKMHLERMFRGANPLNYIQDVTVEENREETHCVVRLKVPSLIHQELQNSYHERLYNIEPLPVTLRRMADQAIAAAVMGEFNSRGVQKAPEKEPPKPIKPEEKKPTPMELRKPERVVFSGPKTILFWPDGTKTMVSLMEGQEHDEYGAFCAAFLKKMFGSTHKAKKFLNSVKVVQEPKGKKGKYEQMEMEMAPMPSAAEEESSNG